MKQKIIFTALPNGINPDTKNVKLSVAISLQVTETDDNTTLNDKDLVDILNWPTTISQADFKIQVNDGQPFTVQKNTDKNHPPASVSFYNPNIDMPDTGTPLWNNLFTGSVKVNAFVVEDKTNIPILSYPVKLITDYIKTVVEKTGKSYVTDMPDMNSYTGDTLFTDISNYKLDWVETGKDNFELVLSDAANSNTVKSMLQEQTFIPFNPGMDAGKAFAQLYNFHGMYDVKPAQDFEQFSKPDFEFHDIISILSQHPVLMRRLGLVIDFEIPVNQLSSASGTISVFPGNLNFSIPTEISCPKTAYEKTTNGFYTKSKDNSFYNKGHVKINAAIDNEQLFTVYQIDADGAAIKLVSHIDALQLKAMRQRSFLKAANVSSEPLQYYNNELLQRREGLPANRSAGIAIAKNGLAEYLYHRFERANNFNKALAGSGDLPEEFKNFAKSFPAKNITYSSGTSNTTGDNILYADDVTIGYRMDVAMVIEGKPDNWLSLHFHENRYSYLDSSGKEYIPIDNVGKDEGFIQLSTSKDLTVPGEHMKLSETVARWEGWSLAVPMPGLALNEPKTFTDPDKPYREVEDIKDPHADAEKYLTPGDVDFKLNVIPVISKGTLPRLRFGQAYKIKLRTVDMAGNSVPYNFDPTDENIAGEAIVNISSYRRYEPVDVPSLIPGEAFRDGESSEVMVIRSNENKTAAEYESSQTSLYKSMCTRHVKPPRTTVGMAINHNMLEKAIGLKTQDTQTGLQMLGAGIVYNQLITKDPSIKSKNFVDPLTNKETIAYNPDAIAQVINSDTASLTVDYLADPMAAGVSFFVSAVDPNNLSQSQKNTLEKRVSFYLPEGEVTTNDTANEDFDYNAWMNPKTFRIVLQEGTTFTIEWKNKNSERILTVGIPKGFMLKLNYACFWKPKDIVKLSGVLDMMSMTDLNDEIGQSIAKGQHWLFSPWRTITFVHAVQQPLTKVAGVAGAKIFLGNVGEPVSLFTGKSINPGILNNVTEPPVMSPHTAPFSLPYVNHVDAAERKPAETFARLNMNVDIHAASTGIIDIQASWSDPVDNGNPVLEHGFELIHHTAKVYHCATEYNDYSYVFGNIPDEKINESPLQKLFNKVNKKEAVVHHFNDTKHRWVSYGVIASTRYKEYFFHLINPNPTVTDSDESSAIDITRESNRRRVNVLSSARPLAPQVAYVIPTFQWVYISDPNEKHAKGKERICNLRVYLKRPWYSSGEGEKLAVIALKQPYEPTSPEKDPLYKELEQIFTTWGNDPTKSVFGANGVFPATSAFVAGNKKGEIYTEDNLSIEESQTIKANIVAYDVKYDKQKQLYFADVIINYGPENSYFSYFPFIRLSLAAYQQDSVRQGETDCCLSKIVRAEYIQIPPKRITVVKADSDGISVGISGYLSNATKDYSPRIEFIIEPVSSPKSEDVVLTIGENSVSKHGYSLTAADIQNFAFVHTYNFSQAELTPAGEKFFIPLEGVIVESYWVKIFEYERITASEKDDQNGYKDRLVFADVYEVKSINGNFTVTA